MARSMKTNQKKIGRPSIKTDEIVEAALDRLSHGESLAKICRDPKMPAYATFRRWEDEDSSFKALSSRARLDGTHYMADECIEIADDPEIDPQHKRIMVDTRIRLIGKWNSREYGDKLAIDQTTRVAPMTPEQMTEEMSQSPAFRAEIAEMLAKSANA